MTQTDFIDSHAPIDFDPEDRRAMFPLPEPRQWEPAPTLWQRIKAFLCALFPVSP